MRYHHTYPLFDVNLAGFNMYSYHVEPHRKVIFVHMKKEITSALVLSYYNPKKQTTLQTDSSVKGLGACLLQDSKPVYFASKALTNAQKGYGVI